MSEPYQIHVIMGLRVGVLIAWAMIGCWGLAPMWRILRGEQARSDIFWGSMLLLAAGLILLQWRSLGGFIPPTADRFVGIGLLSLIMSAIGIFVTRAKHSPVGHQRAALLSHMAVLFFSIAAGALA